VATASKDGLNKITARALRLYEALRLLTPSVTLSAHLIEHCIEVCRSLLGQRYTGLIAILFWLGLARPHLASWNMSAH
jgi:hypothetical protein